MRPARAARVSRWLASTSPSRTVAARASASGRPLQGDGVAASSSIPVPRNPARNQARTPARRTAETFPHGKRRRNRVSAGATRGWPSSASQRRTRPSTRTRRSVRASATRATARRLAKNGSSASSPSAQARAFSQ